VERFPEPAEIAPRKGRIVDEAGSQTLDSSTTIHQFFTFLQIWLRCVDPEHEHLASVLVESGFDSVAALRRLRPVDLLNMGVELNEAKQLARMKSYLFLR
jgi:hypothetical protein